MNEPHEQSFFQQHEMMRQPPRGHAAVAWCIIVLLVLFILVGRMLLAGAEGERAEEDPIGISLMQTQAKYMVAANRMTPGGLGDREYNQVSTAMNAGTVGQRLRFIIVAAELRDVAEARQALEDLETRIKAEEARRNFELTEKEAEGIRLLKVLYGDASDEHDAPRVQLLADAERDWMLQEFGWFGQLALGHETLAAAGGAERRQRSAAMSAAQRVMWSLIGVVLAGGIAGFAGFIGLIVVVALVITHRIRSNLGHGNAHHGIYAETFAIWMALFIAMQFVALELGTHAPYWALSISFIAFFSSLIAVIWPVLRGVPWNVVRQDCGLTLRGPSGSRATEPFLGIACYAMGLPILLVGVLLTLLLIALQSMFTGAGQDAFGSTGGPAHPVIQEVIGPHLWPKIQVLMLAAVAAPVVEEIMFRGVLYRHLRDATTTMGMAGSIFVSAGLNAFVFAIIHPQGWVAVPALGSLAVAFCLAREWRGSLVVPIFMHAISNGLVMSVVILLLSE